MRVFVVSPASIFTAYPLPDYQRLCSEVFARPDFYHGIFSFLGPELYCKIRSSEIRQRSGYCMTDIACQITRINGTSSDDRAVIISAHQDR